MLSLGEGLVTPLRTYRTNHPAMFFEDRDWYHKHRPATGVAKPLVTGIEQMLARPSRRGFQERPGFPKEARTMAQPDFHPVVVPRAQSGPFALVLAEHNSHSQSVNGRDMGLVHPMSDMVSQTSHTD